MLSSGIGSQSPCPASPPANLPELEHLVVHEYKKLTRCASWYLENSHDAEDAVQDALLSAYEHLAAFKNESKLSTWLTTIVVNAARARRRRRRPSVSYEQLLEAGDSPALIMRISRDDRPNPEDLYGHSEVSQLLLAFVDQLPPIYRRAVQLFYFHGLSTADASDALGIPVSTFKAQLGRARKQLRRRIHERFSLRSCKAPYASDSARAE